MLQPHQPFLERTEVCTIGDVHRFHVCVVPTAHYASISRAFDLLGGTDRARDINGLVSHFGDSTLVVLPDTVEFHTLVHEAVHLAASFGFTVESETHEEAFAHAVSAIATDLVEAIQTLREKIESATAGSKPKRRRR